MLLAEIQHYKNLDLIAKQVVEGFITGLHKSPFHGFSVEFAEHRLYNSGDSIKNIDWKLYGRTDRLYSKRFEEETNLRCMLVVDKSSSMYFPENENLKIKFSAVACASLMELLRKQRDAFGLITFNNGIDFQSEIKSSRGHFQRLLAELESLVNSTPKQSTTQLAQVLHEIAEKVHRRSMIVIFTDLLQAAGNEEEALFDALRHLKFGKHEIVLFHISHTPKEIDFLYGNNPIRVVDVESNISLKVNPTEVRELYKSKTKEYFERISQKCSQYRIEFVNASVENDFTQILLPFYVKRQRMK